MEMKTIDSIYARVCERRTNYETVVVSKFPELFPISRPIVLGQYSMTEQAGKRGERRRFITRRDSIKLGEHIETPTAIARDYLNVEKLRAPRLRGNIDAIRQSNARGTRVWSGASLIRSSMSKVFCLCSRPPTSTVHGRVTEFFARGATPALLVENS